MAGLMVATRHHSIDRRNPPKCAECNHARSFHGGGRTKCQALGCPCAAFAPLSREELARLTLTVDEAAEVLGKGQTWVREHAVELGGAKVANRWRFPESVSVPS